MRRRREEHTAGQVGEDGNRSAVVCTGPSGAALAQGWYSGMAVGAWKLDVPTRSEFDGLLFR